MEKYICPNCSESNEINFDICWNCQYLFNGNETLIEAPQKKENIIKKKPSPHFISTKIGAFICAFIVFILAVNILKIIFFLTIGGLPLFIVVFMAFALSLNLYFYLRNLTNDKIVDGEFYTYYDNGKLKKKANYVSGKLNGELLIYDENSNLIHKQNFKKGKFDGEIIQYNIKGEVILQENYKNGVKIIR